MGHYANLIAMEKHDYFLPIFETHLLRYYMALSKGVLIE